MFRDREDAGRRLAEKLKNRVGEDTIILAVPRGGVAVGKAIAEALGIEMDIVLARKLRAPQQPELAVGAISEEGHVYLTPQGEEALAVDEDYLARERQRQLAEIAWRQHLFRAVRPRAEVAGRSVIVVDDGAATGSTMIAALQAVRAQHPRELIAALPIAAAEPLVAIRHWCDEAVCLLQPETLWAVGQFYEDFGPIDDQQVVNWLKKAGFGPSIRHRGAAGESAAAQETI